MYPKNAASPERIEIGPVVLIADGTVQTSGVAVKVIPQGGVEASGGGTIAYSADGVVLYTPTQAETNYTSFILIASKSACIPASKTIVTTAESTAGRVYVGMLATDSITSSALATSAVTEIQSGLASQTSVDTLASYVDTEVAAIKAKTDNLPSDPADQSLVEAAITAATTGLATVANQTTILDRQGYTLAVLAGACADPQTSAETYAITLGSSTYTVDMAGQTSVGARTAPTLTKT